MECTEPSKTSWQTRISSRGHSCGITTAGNLIGASFWGWLVALHKAKWYPCKYSNNYKFSWNTQTFFLLKSIKRQEIQFLTFLNLYFLSQTILLSILADEVCLAVSLWQGTVIQEPLLHCRAAPQENLHWEHICDQENYQLRMISGKKMWEAEPLTLGLRD